jgi:hypothetical protein
VTMELRSTSVFRGRSLPRTSTDMLKTRTYGLGRICAIDGCGTRLSAYNPSNVCALHSGAWQDDDHAGARKASRRDEIMRRCVFESCGREFTTSNPAKKYCSDACRMRAFQARVVAARRVGDPSLPGARRAS